MFRGLIIFLLLSVPAAAWSAQSGDVSPERPAEYMIYQYPNVALVVKTNAPEVQVTSRIYGPEGALIMASGIPSGRIGPLFQYIAAVDKPRQLMIKITPENPASRSAINMELIQLPAWERNSAAMVHGYSLLSEGTELVHANDTTTWSMKAYTLRRAAQAFHTMGWEEMRLWSELQAAHLVLHKLNDELQAMELAQEIRSSARRAGFEDVQLGALILAGDALMSAGTKSGGAVASVRFEQIHAVMDQVVIMAGRLNLRSEQARALFNDGLAYQQQDQQDAAIRQFQRALDVSLSADNPELVKEIRSTAAAAYESLGSNADAIELLEDIGVALDSDENQEVTDNLFEKGRILNASFRYPEAADELSQALNLLQSGSAGSASRGAVGLALAWSYYSMGDLNQAVNLLMESIPGTVQTQNAEALERAYRSLANIYRERENFEQMLLYRGKQRALARSSQQRIGLFFESAMDTWHRDGSRSREARALLDRMRQASMESGDRVSAARADLYLCLLNIEQAGRDACAQLDLSRLHAVLESSGIPKLAMESEFVRAKILRRAGRVNDALVGMDRLIGDILRLRWSLPGVLGAWYWETKDAIFDEYMAMTLAQSATDGKRVLLALNRIRSVESDRLFDSKGNPADDQDDALRSLIARREDATGAEADTLAAQINEVMLNISATPAGPARPLSLASLDRILAGLSQDESLLTFHLGEDAAFVLIGTSKAVSMFKLPGSLALPDRLNRLRDQIQGGSESVLPALDALGRDMLEPVARYLTKKIYVLPAGALTGFPFDALRLKGRFIAESHQVVNLMGLSTVQALHPPLTSDFMERVFLAGNPRTSQELFSYDVQVSPEISAFTDRFVGPGLHIVQGVALRTDEFQDTRFAGAGLIHLAIPGTIDLADADRSSLLMSRAGTELGAENLVPADIRELRFTASLAVLSLINVSGYTTSGFNKRLGFVSDFLDAGVSFVMASTWTGQDLETVSFITDFYDNIEAGQDVIEAFAETRKRRLLADDETNLKSWAGFQLFMR